VRHLDHHRHRHGAAKKKYPENIIFYCPLDFSWAVKAAMRRIRPDVLVLAELELWPNLIRAAKSRSAKVAVINGDWERRVFVAIAEIRRSWPGCCDNRLAGRPRRNIRGAIPHPWRSARNGPRHRLDEVTTGRKPIETIRHATAGALAGFAEDDVVLLAGSTQEPEEVMLLETFRALSPQWPNLRLVLVPRHPDRFEAVANCWSPPGSVATSDGAGP